MIRPEHRETENASCPGDVDCLAHRGNRMRIFGTGIDVSPGRTGRDAGDHHALDQHKGIAFHDHPVGKGGAVAFVGIADDIFLRRHRLHHSLPLDAGRETGTAAPSQPAFGDLSHNLGPRHRDSLFQSFQPLIMAIIIE
ncbi:hypothetical protein D3C71_845130 [compost metagenome]